MPNSAMPDHGRRRFVAALGGTAVLTLWPKLPAFAAAQDARLLVVMLRGAMDGLHLLPPIGDPGYARARGALAVTDGLALDGNFALHPQMRFAHELYGKKQLAPLLATAPPYRQRSHFDAQDCLENGTNAPGGSRSGWLGRCVAAMPTVEGVAVASVMPLSLRGAAHAETWSPPMAQALPSTLLQQLQPLYAQDARLSAVFADAVNAPDDPGSADAGMAGARTQFGLPQAMAAAARLMSPADGPRVGFVEDSGWDTHRGQAAVLQRKFVELDAGLRAAHDGFGQTWSRTAVVIVTEFGRTVAVNGTAGTDHGTGGLAL
ncbi:MAG: DUF1501 domain-containing protein, partial [Luteimonas sp.]